MTCNVVVVSLLYIYFFLLWIHKRNFPQHLPNSPCKKVWCAWLRRWPVPFFPVNFHFPVDRIRNATNTIDGLTSTRVVDVRWLTFLGFLPDLRGPGFTLPKSLELPSSWQAWSTGEPRWANLCFLFKGPLKWDFRSATVCGKRSKYDDMIWHVFSVLATVRKQFVLIIVGYIVERCVSHPFLISFIYVNPFSLSWCILSFVWSFIWYQLIWLIHQIALFHLFLGE